MAAPSQDRWHKQPKALYGGIGIYIAFIIMGVIAVLNSPIKMNSLIPYAIFFIGATGCFLLGLLDDILLFKPTTKIVGQIACASLFILLGGSFNVSEWPLLNILVSYFWFLGIINAINLLDNMDGLASGVTIICSIILLSLNTISGHELNSLPIIINGIFIMSVIGFWLFNRHPASIFMGDAGSLFLGYTLAVMPIIHSNASLYSSTIGLSSIFSLLIPVTVLAIPVFDTTLVTITRKFSGRAISQGGKDHSSHRLVGLGFSEKASVNILYGLSIVGGLTAILMALYEDSGIFIFTSYVVFLLVIGIYLGKLKVYSRDEALNRKSGWTPVVRQIMYKKRILEVMLDVALVTLAYFFAWYIYRGKPQDLSQSIFMQTIPAVMIITTIIFRISNIYRGVWSLISIEDLMSFAKAIFISVLATIIINTIILDVSFSSRLYTLYTILLCFVIMGSRISFRFFDMFISTIGLSKRPQKILIYGAGVGGKILINEIKQNNKYKDINPLGFVDDDLTKSGRSVSGIKVLGNLKQVIKLIQENKLTTSELWVTSKTIDPVKIDKLKNVLPANIKIRKMKFDMIPFNPIDTPKANTSESAA
ncbi:hypothetical protein BVY03_02450 [bacterium K02(2017)]|nr:hypothetical protein BVY03_02450 [bacterium K02(2017)]